MNDHDPTPPPSPLDEAARQAREQGASDGFRVPDLEAAVAAHGGRFLDVMR